MRNDINNKQQPGSAVAGSLPGWLCALLSGVFCLLVQCPVALAGQPDPRVLLQEMTDQVLAEIRKDPEQLQDVARVRVLADRYILPHIDFYAAAQWVLGKHWRMASEQQRQRFAAEFRALLLNTYLRSITTYHENVIRILPLRAAPQADRAEVDAEVEQPGGPTIHVGFRLHRAAGEWLVYDITIDGISLVTTHRSGFSREITEQGLDSLIARLSRMNSDATAERAAPLASPATPN